MQTTALFVEILIVGLEALAWVLLLGLTMFGSDWLHVSELEKWVPLVTVVVLALAYIMGILVDRLADSLFTWFERTRLGLLVNRRFGEGSFWYTTPAGVSTMRLTVMRDSEGIAKFLDYQRSRVRIMRSTVLNLLIALPVVIAFLTSRLSSGPLLPALWAVFLATLTVSALYASERIRSAYINRLSDAYLLLSPSTDDAERAAANRRTCRDGIKGEVAAAVCYDKRGREVSFLLVTTKGDKRMWTFPKGHREEGETLAQAARREAQEEAGAVGELADLPLTHYLVPASRDEDRGAEYCVEAYLLRVTDEVAPTEGGRERGWFSARDARRKVAEGGRERRYVREHRRVLKNADRSLIRP